MEQNKCNKCGRPMQYATEPKCNYCDACMGEYCGCKLGRIKEMEPTCDSTAVIPSITVESVEGITNLANCLVHVNDINTTFYVDDKHRVMITWAGPVNIPGYDMEGNPEKFKDQIVTDVEAETAVIYDSHGNGYIFGITPENLQQAINDKLDEMAADGTLTYIISQYIGEPIFGFDTVADMKASTTLQAGDRTRTLGFYTLNDGGGAFYKIRALEPNETANNMTTFLMGEDKIAELIHDNTLNLKQLGCNNDNFSACANYALTNGYNVYVPKGNYIAKATINLKGNDLSLVSDGDITSQATVLFHVEGYRNYLQLRGKYTGDNTVNSILVNLGGGDSGTVANNVYIHAAINFGTAIKLCPENGKGVAYTNVSFDYLGGCKLYGIHITTGTGVSFVAENNFTGGRIAGASGMSAGIKFTKGVNQVDQFNANIFTHVCIDEHYQIGIDIEHALYNKFIDTRLSEGLDGNYYVQIGTNCQYNYISTKSGFRPTQINDLTTDRMDRNFFEARLIDTSTFLIADKFFTANGFLIVERADCVYGLNRTNLLYTYNTTTNPTLPEFYVNGGTVVRLGHDTSGTDTFTYTLPSVFNVMGINEFYLEITNLNTANDINIMASDGTTLIVDRTTLGSGTLVKKWFKVEYVAQIDGNAWKVTPLNG